MNTLRIPGAFFSLFRRFSSCLYTLQGVEKRLPVENTNADGTDSVEDVDHPTHAHAAVSVVPNAEQLHWDGRDAQAHALIALSVKRAIIPHIRSCKIAKDVLFQARNEARVAYLRKHE